MKEAGFDEFAEFYREVHSRNLSLTGADSFYFARMKAEMIASVEGVNYSLNVLDLGCGDGVLLNYLSQLLTHAEFTGIDESSVSIRKARALFPDLNFEVDNVLSLARGGVNYDLGIMACVLHHVDKEKRLQALQQVRRVLKPGGRLYIFEHNPWNPFTRYLVRTCEFDKGVKLLLCSELLELLNQAGFSVQQKRYYLFFPPGKFQWLDKLEKLLANIPLGGQYFIVASVQSE